MAVRTRGASDGRKARAMACADGEDTKEPLGIYAERPLRRTAGFFPVPFFKAFNAQGTIRHRIPAGGPPPPRREIAEDYLEQPTRRCMGLACIISASFLRA